MAHTKLSYSRAFIVRAYLMQTHEMLFDAHTAEAGIRADLELVNDGTVEDLHRKVDELIGDSEKVAT